MKYRLLPEAVEDIEAIVMSISNDNPKAAQLWLEKLTRTFENLASMPLMGVARFDVRPELRLFSTGNYLILHRASDDGVDIVRVIHGAREWQDLI